MFEWTLEVDSLGSYKKSNLIVYKLGIPEICWQISWLISMNLGQPTRTSASSSPSLASAGLETQS